MRNRTKNTKIWRISIPNRSKDFVRSINVIYTNKWNVVLTGINDTNHLYIVSDVHIHFTNFVTYLTFMVLRNHMENHKTNPNTVDIFILSSVIFSYTSKLLNIVHLKKVTMWVNLYNLYVNRAKITLTNSKVYLTVEVVSNLLNYHYSCPIVIVLTSNLHVWIDNLIILENTNENTIIMSLK